MNRLLASDFDRTLYRAGCIAPEDIAAIHRWQQDGHLFVLATGRSEYSVRPLLERAGVFPDYLLCNNGAWITPWQGAPLQEAPLEADVVLSLLVFLFSRTGLPADLTLKRERVQVDPDGTVPALYNGVVRRMPLAAWRQHPAPALQVHLRFADTATCRRAAQWIRQSALPVLALVNEWNLDIVRPELGKAASLAFLARKLAFTGRISAVGDSFNDLEMIRRYDGYTLQSACDEMRRLVSRQCTGVADCIAQELSGSASPLA